MGACPAKAAMSRRTYRQGLEGLHKFYNLAAHRRRCASAIRWRPSGVLGPVLAPPWFRHRPPRPMPLR